MDKIKKNSALWSFVLVPVTLVVLWIAGAISKSNRPDLACKGQPDCVDLRGLGNIYLAFLFISFVAAIATGIAYSAQKQNQKSAKAAVVINAVLIVIFLAMALWAYLSSH